MLFARESAENIRAEKLSKRGAVYYSNWRNEHGDRSVRIEANEVGGVRKKGTFSPSLFRLTDIGDRLPMTGYDPETGKVIDSRDKNMSGFLRAVKIDAERRAVLVTSSRCSE